MTPSATIFELDQFRRLRDALSVLRRPTDQDAKPKQAVDWYLPGFIGKARVSTAFGELPIEALRPRDDLRTFSGVSASVRVVDKIHLDQDFLKDHAYALPIMIPANALGSGRPSSDLLLSPGQEVSL
ncbi:MAG: Hint domain-containing protein, partial [Tabrizicola sp.]